MRVCKYDMCGFLDQCVNRYLELSHVTAPLKHVATPFLDEGTPEFDENDLSNSEVGILGDIASAVLMKILYAARMGRYDLLRPVGALASRVTKWIQLCDRRLHRLVAYIKSSRNVCMYSWVGDSADKLELVMYCDADLAGDRNDSKSTSGVFLCIVGPCSFFPLAGISKKQTSVSKSTPEAEIVALDHGVCKEGIPALALWTKILGRSMQIRVMEDNDAASRIIITSRNPSMRHMSRTQRIDVAWLNERFSGGDFGFVTCPSEFQAADIMTKSYTDVVVWRRNLILIGHFESGKWLRR